jgi:hypothetical protein
MSTDSKSHLPLQLLKLKRKVDALFLKQLVLFEEESDSGSDVI